MRYKLILWGLGSVYNKCLNIIKYYEYLQQIQIVAVTSNPLYDFGLIDGYKIVSNNKLPDIECDYIMVMNDRHFAEIVGCLTDMGISRKKILNYKILQYPNINFEEYIKLKNSDITIISNNCWGGCVYNTLGLECLSPFKNLFLEDEDYIKVLKNLKYYCGQKVQPLEYLVDIHSNERYPVLQLGDVKIHCNHDSSYEGAAEKWNRRVSKINYQNLFVEMYAEDRKIAYEFSQLNYDKKVCFVPFESDINSCYKISIQAGQKEFWEAVNSNGAAGNYSWAYNVIKMLNGDINNSRIN